ncbi:hypothetical protein N1027_01450 [Herbiconiux sp. CPCC 205763]|uniref:Hpt domain-containing protein n=1 Tax=Herbiconiux aconitum TaxID=2970913 RepID=A0ABT2GKY5_9MICO|nr:hypothetical protein [Herbiconiux aconitum]MCS5716796.1 hypothetical protein [Herbiconiux aconitum]
MTLALLNSIGDESSGRFVLDFINLWETRSQRLMNALSSHDFDEADVVLLSIRSSSTMLGAWPLEAIAGMVHAAVKKADLSASLNHLPRLREVGDATCQELRAVLDRPGPSHPISGDGRAS